jgi:microcystin-dependent protein
VVKSAAGIKSGLRGVDRFHISLGAKMSDQFLAEIRIFPFNFAPTQWAFCNGQLLPLSQYTALFSLIGTYYGGDGRTTFQLPNLQGNVPVDAGQGAGLSLYDVGEQGGSQTVTLLDTENPVHNHLVNASGKNATSTNPSGNVYAKGLYEVSPTDKRAVNLYTTTAPGTTTLKPTAIGLAGGGQAHNNMMPYLTLNFCIAMQGIFPARS